MHEGQVRDLAILISQGPDGQSLVSHLATITLASFQPSTVALYVLEELPHRREMLLIGHEGLTAQEVANYSRIDTGLDVPVTRALHHSLPWCISLADFPREFPMLATRPSFGPELDQVLIPVALGGVTVAALAFTIPQAMKWDPDAWHNALALQALLVLYLRTAGHVGRSTTTRTRSLAPARSLTDRQKRILALAAQGKSTSSIAARLGFSESTVKQTSAEPCPPSGSPTVSRRSAGPRSCPSSPAPNRGTHDDHYQRTAMP